MQCLGSFLEAMGRLHDSVVQELKWIPEEKTLCLAIADCCANFKDLPEYPGATPGIIELYGVENIEFAIASKEEKLTLYEFQVEAGESDMFKASITFWPSGRIEALYRSASFPQIALRK